MEKRKAIEYSIPELIPTRSVNQKKAADFFPARLDWVAWLPIRDVAAIAGGSEASIIRLAPPSGDDGYQKPREELSNALKNQLPPTGYCHCAITNHEKIPARFTWLAHAILTTIHAATKSQDAKIFPKVTEDTTAAPDICDFSQELTHHLSRRMTYFLRQCHNSPAHYRSRADSPYPAARVCMHSNKVRRDFSFSPDSREAVAAITDTKVSPVPGAMVADKKTTSVREVALYCLSIKTVQKSFTNLRGCAGQGVACQSAQTEFPHTGPDLKYAKHN